MANGSGGGGETGRSQATFPPFELEIDHPRNSDILLQSIPNMRLRSAIEGGRTSQNSRTGEERVPVDQARALAGFPKTPGQRILVNPRDGSYVVNDPLRTDESLCDRIRRWMRDSGQSVEKVVGVPTQTGVLDPHRFKTLVRELIWLVEANEAKVIRGVLPSLADCAELPGHFLLNPGSRVPNTQPVYEKDFPDWVARLSHSGG